MESSRCEPQFGLPEGEYSFCVEVPSAPYLDPCKWSTAAKARAFAEETAAPTIVLKRGVFLKVRVNDPQGLLPLDLERPLGGGNLIIGVIFGNGAFHGARVVSSDRVVRDYQIAIPTDRPLKLWTFSRHVTLTDSSGAPVDNSGANIPFQPKPNEDYLFTLNVASPVATRGE